jgi:hypothetical protein
VASEGYYVEDSAGISGEEASSSWTGATRRNCPCNRGCNTLYCNRKTETP